MKYAIDNKNINDCYNEFNNLLVTLTNKHLKATTVKQNKYKHKKCKWMTNGILKNLSGIEKYYVQNLNLQIKMIINT